LALNTSGNVWFWGRNLYGQLGNGNPNTISTPPTYNYNMAPTQITGLSNITAISTSDYGCLALNTSGNVWFWGLNQYGQDGSGNTNTATAPSNLNYYMTPNQIPGLTNITAISMFIAGCLALDTTGNVWFWGYNSNGQLGNGNTNTVTAPSNINYYITPTIVSGLPAITAISIHNSGCLALDTTGNVWFWGKNDKGQLGNINPNSATTSFTYYNCYMTPTQITGLSNITSISINTYGCLAL
jgi:alpha-tubulin suppressor-like RCC1 family protein